MFQFVHRIRYNSSYKYKNLMEQWVLEPVQAMSRPTISEKMLISISDYTWDRESTVPEDESDEGTR